LQIAKPLNNLLKKGAKRTFRNTEKAAIEKLKKLICEEPVLIQPDQMKPFEVEVDASNYAIRAVLMQHNEKKVLHPVAFFSKTMNKVQRNYDVYNHELLGLHKMFRHWRHYLHQAAHKVKVHTDHASLLFWKNPRDHNRRVAWWHAELMDYDFELCYGWLAIVSNVDDGGVCPECRQREGSLPCYNEASTTERCWDRGGRDAHKVDECTE
jgi:hypothetical protein